MSGIISSVVAGKISLESLLRDGTPNIIKKEINAKKMLEAELKSTCEQLITQESDVLVGNLALLLQELSKEFKEKTGGETKAILDKLSGVLKAMLLPGDKKRKTARTSSRQKKTVPIKDGLTELSKRLRQYLSNVKLENMLFDPILANVKRALKSARELITKNTSNTQTSEELESVLLQLESEVLLYKDSSSRKRRSL
eukprot:172165-Amorphochlora_amoeboformis.AAC.1